MPTHGHALQMVAAHFTDDVFLDWLACIASVDSLALQLAQIPATFEQYYVRAAP